MQRHHREIAPRLRLRRVLTVLAVAAALLPVPLLLLGGCGGSSGGAAGVGGLGTVTLVNDSHLGMAPTTIQQFFFLPAGSNQTPVNLLREPIVPGAQAIVGLFAEGTYNGVAVISGGFGINFNDIQVVTNQPTTLTVP